MKGMKVFWVLIIVLTAGLFFAPAISAQPIHPLDGTGTGSTMQEVRVISVQSPVMDTCPGGIVGQWTENSYVPTWVLTFNADGTFSDNLGETGTWTTIDPAAQIFQLNYMGNLWTIQFAGNCNSLTISNDGTTYHFTGNSAGVPEFPSLVIPGAAVFGLLGVVLLARTRKE